MTVKSEMNLQEYFASKMAALRQKSEVRENGETLELKMEPERETDRTKKRKKAKKDRLERVEYKEVKLKKNSNEKKKKNLENVSSFGKSKIGISECPLEGQTENDLEVDAEPRKMRKMMKKASKCEKLSKLQNLEKEGLKPTIVEDDGNNSEQDITHKEDQCADGGEDISVKKVKKKKKKEKREKLMLGAVGKVEDRNENTFKTNNEYRRAKDAETFSNYKSCEPHKKKKRKLK